MKPAVIVIIIIFTISINIGLILALTPKKSCDNTEKYTDGQSEPVWITEIGKSNMRINNRFSNDDFRTDFRTILRDIFTGDVIQNSIIRSMGNELNSLEDSTNFNRVTTCADNIIKKIVCGQLNPTTNDINIRTEVGLVWYNKFNEDDTQTQHFINFLINESNNEDETLWMDTPEYALIWYKFSHKIINIIIQTYNDKMTEQSTGSNTLHLFPELNMVIDCKNGTSQTEYCNRDTTHRVRFTNANEINTLITTSQDNTFVDDFKSLISNLLDRLGFTNTQEQLPQEITAMDASKRTRTALQNLTNVCAQSITPPIQV